MSCAQRDHNTLHYNIKYIYIHIYIYIYIIIILPLDLYIVIYINIYIYIHGYPWTVSYFFVSVHIQTIKSWSTQSNMSLSNHETHNHVLAYQIMKHSTCLCLSNHETNPQYMSLPIKSWNTQSNTQPNTHTHNQTHFLSFPSFSLALLALQALARPRRRREAGLCPWSMPTPNNKGIIN